MKKQIILFIFFCVLIIIIPFTNIPYKEYISLILLFILVLYKLIEVYNIARQNVVGEFIFRQQKKSSILFIINLVIAIVLTLVYSNAKSLNSNSLNIVLVGFWWIAVLFHLVNNILISKLKPISLIINDNQIVLNFPFKSIREISEITQIKLNGLTDEIKIHFKKKSSLIIQRGEYKPLDIEQFIALCNERSKGNIIISDNLKRGRC